MESEQRPQFQDRSTPDDGETTGQSTPVVGESTGAQVPPSPPPPPTGVPPSRAGRLWVGMISALVLLVLMLVFIFQNLHNVKISFFTASGSFPLALALLLAAVVGALIVFCLGSIRIIQLRRTVRRRSRRTRASANGQTVSNP
jgi:uncharacterized integral membrane protein